MKGDIMQLDEYFKIIDNAAEKSEDFVIPNRDARHASYLIKTLFRYAKEEVCALTGGLFEGVWGNDSLKEEAVKFLRAPSSKLKIAFQSAETTEEVLSRSFMKYICADKERKGTVEIYNAIKIDPPIKNHFFVSDGKAFRYELDPDTRQAVANFGDLKNGQRLASIFSLIITKSDKVFAC